LTAGGGGWRSFWLTLFAIGAVVLLVGGWRGGEPWTAAAFVAFFISRVVRSVLKRPLTVPAHDDPVRRMHRFLLVTAAGWIASGSLATIAVLAGEGQEWLYVAPFFLVMGGLNLYVMLRRDGARREG
jgi:Trk-type K+ transport system membrane component